VVKVDQRIRWHYTTTILRLRIGARLTRYRDCKFHNFARTISRHVDGISRYSVPPSAGPLLPLVSAVDATLLSFAAERRRRSSRSISPALWVHSSSERSETGEWWDGRTERQMDRRTPDRYKDPALHRSTMPTVSTKKSKHPHTSSKAIRLVAGGLMLEKRHKRKLSVMN